MLFKYISNYLQTIIFGRPTCNQAIEFLIGKQILNSEGSKREFNRLPDPKAAHSPKQWGSVLFAFWCSLAAGCQHCGCA